MNLDNARLLVVGAGLMGAGIAQVAAQAGHDVLLFDTRDGAAAAAKGKLAQTLDGLVAKGKLTADAVQATLARITPVDALAPVALVIEAIVEDADIKRALFAELEVLLADDAVIATNTSSISVTALARGMKKPERLVGMHFFNPVPLMKLVEVVSGLGTAPEVAQAIHALAGRWGKTAVHTRSTPGFIVNRIARPYYAEALMLLQERAAAPEVIDACLRSAGFRMGPCELMDLIGHDTNFAVTQSVFAANFFDRRFTPSLVQQELVDAGFFGRKSGRGFYRYPEGAPPLPAVSIAPPRAGRVVVHGRGALAER
ncbi:MAG TPA: 3-hydroxyacyl-CoA dehydrogenase NAD-binding domain-containing protein, partial [Roseateles sp.]